MYGAFDEGGRRKGDGNMDAILLAAGNSTRFGENKLLYGLHGKQVYRYMLELLANKQKEGVLDRVVVVSQYDEIFADIKEHFPDVSAVRNPAPEKGISGSIRLGLTRLLQESGTSEACLFTVADQPGFSAASLDRMAAFWRSHAFGIVAACHTQRLKERAMIKNPVIFSSRYYAQLLELTGDFGGKQVARRHTQDIGLCEIPVFEMEDLDTKDALLGFAFPFLAEKGHVISIVGAGGKTTLMETLADDYAKKGHTVVITTTTHIVRPKRYPIAYNRAQLHSLLAANRVAAAGADALEGKLRMSDEMGIDVYRREADVVLIEADGAKRLPCKVPNETEPVIPKECDLVIGVAGMDALGVPLSECCFRTEHAAKLLQTDARHILTGRDLARILHSQQGTRKNVGNREYYIVLNKCDTKHLQKQAALIRQMLEQAGERHVVCIALHDFQRAVSRDNFRS